jgi:Domain of unknown function (DUF4082)
MSQSIYSSQTPAAESSDGGTPRQLGLQFTVDADGSVTGGRYWVPSTGVPPTAFWQLWRVSDQARLSNVDLNSALSSPSPSAWADFSLGAAVDITASTDYVVCNYTNGGTYVVTDDGSDTFPVTSGHLSASTGRFRNGGAVTDFIDASYDAYFFSDVLFDAAGATVTGALAGTGPALSGTLAGTVTVTGTLAGTGPALAGQIVALASNAASVATVAAGRTSTPAVTATYTSTPTVSDG